MGGGQGGMGQGGMGQGQIGRNGVDQGRVGQDGGGPPSLLVSKCDIGTFVHKNH